MSAKVRTTGQRDELSSQPLMDAAPFWRCFTILAGRGGIGKTLTAMLLTVALLQKKRKPKILQADIQTRLQALFPDFTVNIDIDQLENMENDPLALARAFSAIPRTVRECARDRSDLVIDTAATWHLQVIRYAAEIGLGRKIADLGGQLTFLLPVSADIDAISLAFDTARKIEEVISPAEIVFIKNEYPAPVDFNLDAVRSAYGEGEIRRLLDRHRQIRLAAINRQIWGPFERANLSALDVISAEPDMLTSITDSDIDTVELMQARVETWMVSFTRELHPLLQFKK